MVYVRCGFVWSICECYFMEIVGDVSSSRGVFVSIVTRFFRKRSSENWMKIMCI